jgi:uncharacterized protein (DUF362 family)
MRAGTDSREALVAVERVTDDVRSAVRRVLEAVSFRDVLPRGEPVALKVNLGWDLFIPGSITSPLVLEALILELRPHVGRMFVVEADQVLENVERAFRESGMAEVCRRHAVEWVNTTREPTVPVEVPDNVVLRRIEVPRVLRTARLVTVPVMKTHAKTCITGALKNQWGCLPKMRHEYHLVLDDALADVNRVVRPALCLMDGTVALEGNGPKSGHPRIANLVLGSTDPVALDTVQARIMGFDPARVRHLATCAARGIGVTDLARIDVRGLEAARGLAPFRPPRHNAVSRVETLLRRSWAKRLFFNTPLFHACLWGAKVYYLGWTALRARRAWSAVLDHPVYGPQWARAASARGIRA